MAHPQILHTVLDAVDVRREGEFWRQLLGLVYRPGDEVPEGPGEVDDLDWLVLTHPDGRRALAFQQVAEQARTTWPDQTVPMQLHLDLTVADSDELAEQRARALDLGATVLLDRTDDEDEPLYVFADPEGHPFCIFVA
jgi:catechol 2,3-dioxygenase-like lactoylglutathione lyase family enzyme